MGEPYVPQGEHEIEAAAHVRESVETNGIHSTAACPYPCRAMCRWRKTLEAMEAKGWVSPVPTP